MSKDVLLKNLKAAEGNEEALRAVFRLHAGGVEKLRHKGVNNVFMRWLEFGNRHPNIRYIVHSNGLFRLFANRTEGSDWFRLDKSNE